MPTFKLILEYDGTSYAGWQRQPDQPTVQAALEDAIQKVTQTHIAVIGAGRTDTGVHALGQVVSFRSDKPLSPRDWRRALNAHLPPDISVQAAESVSDDFHARHWAKAKQYEYRILHQPDRPALERNRAWHIYGPLDLDNVQTAASLLLGRHDFSSFQGHPTDTKDPICNLERLDLLQEGPRIRLVFVADRFLKQMVRAIVGTLVEVGQGKRQPQAMKDILEAKDRRAAGYTAPAQGLYLMRVEY
ncbi:MAG: tRNA pseudouridine(38-40) synthase TruA [Nitrospirota bacterium]|nr:tRNA pseudouridine(38-40) synthase TruA [Nitrospirota bacterium]